MQVPCTVQDYKIKAVRRSKREKEPTALARGARGGAKIEWEQPS